MSEILEKKLKSEKSGMSNGDNKLIVAPKGYPGKKYVMNKGGEAKYAYAHRVNAWRSSGKNPNGKIVDHKNGDKSNSSKSNVKMMTETEHKSKHGKRQNKDRANTSAKTKAYNKKARARRLGKAVQDLRGKLKKIVSMVRSEK